MGFKLPGKSIQTGTSSHSSALKMREQEITSALKMKASPAKANAYGGDRSWEQGQKESVAAGGDLNQTTRDQKAYEKKMKSENKDWNKREDNAWKKRQNTINKTLGSKKVYDVDPESRLATKTADLKEKQVVTDKKIVDKGETKMAKKGPQQTNEEGENKAMVKTDKKDRKFVRKDEKLDRKITRRKAKGKSTARLEGKKVTNKQKETEFGESLG